MYGVAVATAGSVQLDFRCTLHGFSVEGHHVCIRSNEPPIPMCMRFVFQSWRDVDWAPSIWRWSFLTVKVVWTCWMPGSNEGGVYGSRGMITNIEFNHFVPSMGRSLS